MNKLGDIQALAAQCLAEYQSAKTMSGDIQRDREDGLKAYHQEPYGDEVEGRSQVRASDVRDSVEWILPDLIEPFIAGDAMEFEPRAAEDVEPAEAETEAVNYVFMQKNPGFMLTYTAIKDVLLSKNCYIYVGWEDKAKYQREEYQGLSIEQVVMLTQDPDIEIRGYHANGDGLTAPQTYDVLLRRKRDASGVCIYPLPPERVFVNRYHNSISLQDARCVIYEELLTEIDLVEEGVPLEKAQALPSYSHFSTGEELQRWKKEGNLPEPSTGSLRIIRVLNCYIRTDFDGDGIAELRLVRLAGESTENILGNDEIDNIPIKSGAAIPNQHKHFAIALADTLQDIQKIRTVIRRLMLDSSYLGLYPTQYINETSAGDFTYQDLLNRKPFGFVRMQDINGIRTEAPVPFAPQAIQMLEWLDNERDERRGFGRETQGMDLKTLADSTNLVGPMLMNAALKRTKLMARVLAETIFKDVFLAIHEELSKHGRPFMARLKSGFAQINPQDWETREQMIIKVGTGYSDKMEKIAAQEGVLAKQQLVVQAGGMGKLITEENIFNALKHWQAASNIKSGQYFTDPSTITPPPPQPTTEQLAVQVADKEANTKALQAAADAQLNIRKLNDETALKREEIASNHYLKAEELKLKYGANVNDKPAEPVEGKSVASSESSVAA